MRKVLLPSLIILATSLLVVRIFYLQIVDDTLKLKSENNAIKKKYDYPERGYIYDRKGVIVANQASYDIMVIPREVKHRYFRILSIIEHHKEDFIKKLRKLRFTVRDYLCFLPQLNKRICCFSRK
jgi:penicillin-binding protein 2